MLCCGVLRVFVISEEARPAEAGVSNRVKRENPGDDLFSHNKKSGSDRKVICTELCLISRNTERKK